MKMQPRVVLPPTEPSILPLTRRLEVHLLSKSFIPNADLLPAEVVQLGFLSLQTSSSG